ncbi:uncharacterized protein LOC125568335 [Nematostella vectensis]|uniref:uncharacterized protein LOC125561909 n=1 Tax=Nematostella vectensis TaxID=45351 RepID=UPI0020774E3D|nr:uncharacterized protein LOC125561909 [Nematostella vectensis]XP_048586314.1 uncharacterized protein LOC125568335 [Nematostella vectensis]
MGLPKDYQIDIPNNRNSQDSKVIDSRGRNLIETCTALNMRILNGRVVGDLEGKKTCFRYNGSSVVDYIIVNNESLDIVDYFIVNPLEPHLTDHCSLSCSLNLKFTFKQKDNSENVQLSELKRLRWNNEISSELKLLFESEEMQTNLNAALNNNCVDTSVDLFTETLLSACENAGLRYQNNDIKESSVNKMWFDKECKNEKENLRSLGKLLSKQPDQRELGAVLKEKKKSFKKLCRRKKYTHYNNIVNSIDFRNSKNTWKQINRIFNSNTHKQSHPIRPEEAAVFHQHFEQLNATIESQNTMEEVEKTRGNTHLAGVMV